MTFRSRSTLPILVVLSVTLFPGTGSLLNAQRTTGHTQTQSFFARGQTLSTEGGYSGSIVLADFNGDGKLDVATLNGCRMLAPIPDYLSPGYCDLFEPVVTARLGKGDGTFGHALVSDVGNGFASSMVLAGDFNHDGRLDLAISSFCAYNPSLGDVIGEVHAGFGKGDGTFGIGVTFPANCPTSPNFITTGDFNLDGNQDLAVTFLCLDDPTCKVGGVGIFLGLGDYNFLGPVFYPYGGGQIAAGDFNGDGKPDLAVGDSGNVTILWGNGDGTFQVGTPFALWDFLVADFNGDGKSDLVGAIGNQLALLLGNADGTFEPPIPIESLPGVLAAADFNCDGKLDLVVSNDSGVTVFLGNGRGKFRAVHGYGAIPGAIAVGDLNNDGKPDLVVDDNSLTPAHTTVLLNVSSSSCHGTGSTR